MMSLENLRKQDHKVLYVVKRGPVNSRCLLDCGYTALVPNSCLLGVRFVGESDDGQHCIPTVSGVKCSRFMDAEGVLVKAVRVKKERAAVRDMSTFNAEEELHFLRGLVVHNMRSIYGFIPDGDAMDDMVHDIFMCLWEAGYYQSFDFNGRASYTTYLNTAVHNFIVDTKRSPRRRGYYVSENVSLSMAVEGDITLGETIEAVSHSLSLEMRDYLRALEALACKMDAYCLSGTYTYSRLLADLLSGDTPSAVSRTRHYKQMRAVFTSRAKKLYEAMCA